MQNWNLGIDAYIILMSISVASGKKLLGQIASNYGYTQFSDAVLKRKDAFPCLASFVEHGFTDEVLAVREELKEFASHAERDVKVVAKELATQIKGLRTAVITDGTWTEQD